MRPRQRVATAFAHRQPDRVPIDYYANPEIDLALKRHFGFSDDDTESLRQKLGVDFRWITAPYTGPQLFNPPPDVRVNEWGAPMRWISYGAAGYWDYQGWPLRDATIEQVESWPMPSPDDYDYDALPRQRRELRDYFVWIGGHGTVDIINQTGMLRTMEQTLVDLLTDDPVGLRLIDRRMDVMFERLRRSFDALDGDVDMLLIGEDLGSQRGPLISLDLFRKHIRSRMQRFIDLARSYGVPTMLHSDGSVDWVYEDLIDMGVTVVDAVQIECAGMSPASLKHRFGDRLSFHGVWPTTGALEHGSVDDAVAEVRGILDVMMPGGGFAMCPAHSIQSDSPLDNVLAGYEAIHQYGRYR
jgi:uroporphyrinogen decarboxylase